MLLRPTAGGPRTPPLRNRTAEPVTQRELTA